MEFLAPDVSLIEPVLNDHAARDASVAKPITNFIKVKDTILKMSDIIMVQSMSNYSYIYTQSMGKIFTSKTLKYWSIRLNEASFIRVHSSYLINSSYITSINKKDRAIKMDNGYEAHISRHMKLQKITQLNNYRNKI